MKRAISQYRNTMLSIRHLRSFIISLSLIFFVLTIGWSQENIRDAKAASDDSMPGLASKIKTETDPSFIYDYKQSKFVPPSGKTLLIMGQTVESTNEYLAHFSDQPLPGGWSSYWGITEFTGITEDYLNVTGTTHNHQMFVDKFPNTILQSALWMVGTWDVAKRTAAGEFDEIVKKYAAWAKSVKRPIYLRIGYEFDGPHNALEPEDYKKAYTRIVDLIRADGASNIAFVWHSYASPPYKGYSLSSWYPGDDYVDWVAISVFGHAYGSDFGTHCDNVLEFAKEHKKPVMIAESNPIHGIDTQNNEVWEKWFVNYFNFIYQKNIKAVSFINEDWTRLNIPGISEWKDARLYNNKQVSKAWFSQTNSDRFLKQSPDLFQQLGYSK